MTDLIIIHSRDPDFYLLLSHILASAGFPTMLADRTPALGDVENVLAAIVDCSGDPIAVISFCRAFKSSAVTASIPLLALIPARQEGHLLQLLEAGINEVFVRPISPDHILSYLRGLGGSDLQSHQNFKVHHIQRFGALEIDAPQRLIRSGIASAQLSPIEFRLLKCLIEEPGVVRDRTDLIQAAWPPNRHVENRTVDVHIAKLRRRLKHATGKNLIRTIRSSGFVIDTDVFEKS